MIIIEIILFIGMSVIIVFLMILMIVFIKGKKFFNDEVKGR